MNFLYIVDVHVLSRTLQDVFEFYKTMVIILCYQSTSCACVLQVSSKWLSSGGNTVTKFSLTILLKLFRADEEAFVADRDDSSTPGHDFERVCRMCDFNPKGTKNTKDVSRMRSIFLQLKQTPLVKE